MYLRKPFKMLLCWGVTCLKTKKFAIYIYGVVDNISRNTSYKLHNVPVKRYNLAEGSTKTSLKIGSSLWLVYLSCSSVLKQ